MIYSSYTRKHFHVGAGASADIKMRPCPEFFPDQRSGFGFIQNSGIDFQIDRFTPDILPGFTLHPVIPVGSVYNRHIWVQDGLRAGLCYRFYGSQGATCWAQYAFYLRCRFNPAIPAMHDSGKFSK